MPEGHEGKSERQKSLSPTTFLKSRHLHFFTPTNNLSAECPPGDCGGGRRKGVRRAGSHVLALMQDTARPSSPDPRCGLPCGGARRCSAHSRGRRGWADPAPPPARTSAGRPSRRDPPRLIPPLISCSAWSSNEQVSSQQVLPRPQPRLRVHGADGRCSRNTERTAQAPDPGRARRPTNQKR